VVELAPVARRSVVDGAYDQLAAQILGGALTPGADLPPERRLTEQLGVNRQAVREALQRLAQDGLVTIQHGGATRVTDFRRSGGLHLLPRLVFSVEGRLDVDVIRSVVEMRACLAPDIARLAAQRADADHAEHAREIATRMADAQFDDAKRGLMNLDFWDVLVDGANNIAYRFAFNSLRSCYEPYAEVLAAPLAHELHDNAGRARLITAIASHDAPAATKAATRLLAPSSDALLELLAQL